MAPRPDGEVRAMDTAFRALSGLEPDEKKRVLLWLWQKLEVEGQAPSVALHGHSQTPPQQGPTVGALSQPPPLGTLTPKNFMAQKDPKTDVEKITCLAYFLTHSRQLAQFKTKQLTDLNTEAAQPKFSNPGVAVGNAAGSKYLSLAGGGKKQITVLGEKLVDALPDRERVKALPTKRAPRRKKSSKGKSTRG